MVNWGCYSTPTRFDREIVVELAAWVVVALLDGQPFLVGAFETKERCEHAVAAIELAIEMGKGQLIEPGCFALIE